MEGVPPNTEFLLASSPDGKALHRRDKMLSPFYGTGEQSPPEEKHHAQSHLQS